LAFTLPKALFFIAIVYVLIATVIAFWIGRPLIRLSFRNELFNAAFRYALVRLRDAAEAVGFYRGERAERVQLGTRFSEIIANYRRYVVRTIGFTGWNLTMSQAINPLPLLVQAPRLFANQISFGDVMQSSTAFGSVHDGLSFFRDAYNDFASFRAAIIRLHGLVMANEAARGLPTLATENCADGTVSLHDVEVRTPGGDLLVNPLDLHLDPGDTMVITGRSGSGKTTLLRSLAQLWPYTTERCAVLRSGRCSCPSCRMYRSATSERWFPIRPNRATSPTSTSSRRWSRWPLAICSSGSTRWLTGPRCSLPVSNSASRLRVFCCRSRSGVHG